MLNSRLLIVIMVIVFTIASHSVFAVDKSGVTPNTISLPTGPGSIEGLGESFEPSLNTGTAKYAVGLKVPPGTAGHAPNVALSYDGGGSNGPLGFGWKIGGPYIQRQTDKGIPRYVDGNNGVDDDLDGVVDNPEEIDVYMSDSGEELVLTDSGYYFCENEGAFIRYKRVNDHWQAHSPDGTLLEFGITSSGRVMDTDTGHVFKWLLEKKTDTNGNTIVYEYRSFAGTENMNRVYLSKIEYGPGAPPWENFHFISFEYESRPDWFEDNRSGFIVRTGMRLKEIVIGTQGPTLTGHASGDFNHDTKTDYLNRKYVLAYEGHEHWSLLTSVQQVGADNVSTLPPARFGYTVAALPDTISAAGSIIGGSNEPTQVMDNNQVDLVDLNGDGLPDILTTGGIRHIAYLNKGEVDINGGRAIQWEYVPEVGGDQLAWNISLASTSGKVAHLSDMDSDGLSDFVYKSVVGDVYYFRNMGDLNWGQRRVMNIAPGDTSPPSPFGEKNVKTADIDFDKHMDIIKSISVENGAYYQIWYNLGNQRFSKRVTVSQESGVMFSTKGVQIADFNGDRVPDIIRVRQRGIEVSAGLGYGKFAPMHFVPLWDYTLDVQQSGQTERAKLQDITGDGLVDLVIERAEPGQLWYWVNLGNYTLDKRRVINGMPTGIGTDPEIRWADLNGNGSTDLLYSDGHRLPRIQTVDIGELIGAVPSPNMMNYIENGIGGKTTIEYGTSTKYMLADKAAGKTWPDPLPFPVNVVGKAIIDDSMGNKYVTEYSYHNGFYDGNEKEFRGFAKVETREIGDATAPDLIMAYTFDTGVVEKALKGKALQIEAKNAQDEIFYRETNTWLTRTLHNSASGDGRDVTFPFQNMKVRDVIEKGNGTPVQLKWEFEYDDYGNMTRNVEHGRMDAGWDDERIIETSFTSEYPDGQTSWILRSVVENRITDENAVKAAHSRSYYDGNTELGRVSKGNFTMTENWVKNDEWVKLIRSNYDIYGNIIATYDPLYGTQPGHYRELVYDTAYHSFPEKEIIHTGNEAVPTLVFNALYDKGFGTVLSSDEFNGYTTTYTYDFFARLTSITKPPDTEHTVEYDYVLADDIENGNIINWIETRQQDGSEGDGFLHSRSYYDGLSRKIMTRAEGEQPKQIVVTDIVKFNARKSVWKQYLPFLDTGSLDYVVPAGSSGVVEYFYDALGRETKVNQPEVDGQIVFATREYSPLSKTVRDEEQTKPGSLLFGNGRQYIEDGLFDENNNGRLCKIVDVVKLSDTGEALESQVEWLTTYNYDALGNLTMYTDAQGNQRLIDYDGLSRKIFMNDPERGISTHVYDEASNMIETIDAKGQRIIYSYDGVNRLLSEDYLDDGMSFSANISPDVVYGYDAAAGLIDIGDGTEGITANTKGYLAWVHDLSGEEHISYDERGRVTWTVKRIKNPATDLFISYRTQMIYDSMDRVSKLIYPDNDQVTYVYNNRGLLEEMPGGFSGVLINNIDYNPAGKVSSHDFGNGITTLYRYDARLRLSQTDTYRKTDLASPLLSYSYAYDGVSNIRRINDLRLGADVPDGNPRRNSQTFQYDDLYRLTGVSYSFALPAQPDSDNGSIEYRYDIIGNMLSKTSGIAHKKNGFSVTNIGQMTYGGSAGRFNRTGRAAGDPPGPKALSSTDNSYEQRIIEYDNNGNMTDVEGNTYTWDFEDRLVSIENNKMQANYIYDYMDKRIIKSVIPAEQNNSGNMLSQKKGNTLYINQYFEIRDGQSVKYVYAGNKRIARITGTIDSGKVRIQSVILHSGWNLIGIAVSSNNGLPHTGSVERTYRWNSTTRGWVETAPDEPLSQGDVLWLYANNPASLTLKGTYDEHKIPQTLESGNFYSGGLGEIFFESFPLGASGWFYDALSIKWNTLLDENRSFLSNASEKLDAGKTLFVQAQGPDKVISVSQAANILYFHKNHIGSSSLTSDVTGRIHSEEMFYPYGESRLRYRESVPDTYYSFIDKEQDDESGNYYIEARYYNATLCRFLSVEPLVQDPLSAVGDTVSGHPYAYSRNNPVLFIDSDGLSPESIIKKLENRINKLKQEVRTMNDYREARIFLEKEGPITDKDGNRIGLTDEGFIYDHSSDPEEGVGETKIMGYDADVPFTATYALDTQGTAKEKRTQILKQLQAMENKAKTGTQVTPKPTPKPKVKSKVKTKRKKRRRKPRIKVTIGPVQIVGEGSIDEISGMSHPDYPGQSVDPEYGVYGSWTECVGADTCK